MEKIKITVIEDGRDDRILTMEKEKAGKLSIKDLLQQAGYELTAPCGGKGICGRCLVEVDGKQEKSCRIYPSKDITVRISQKKTDVVMEAPVLKPQPLKEGLGLAVDIGTTTVAAYLYDLKAGKSLAMAGALNAQKIFGADVISRIQYARDDQKMLQETSVIREQVYDLILELLEKAREKTGRKLTPQDIHYVTIAGNTVMQHLFAAMNPSGIGVAPFKPVSLFGEEIIAEPTMYFCPCISGYVGGDTTAALLSSGMAGDDRMRLLIDLGTNCEFALGNKDGFICCSSPAGPAFECGSGDQSLRGSELISIVARLLRDGIVDETGYLEESALPEELKGKISIRDVRNLQLAKAAVRAAVEIMQKKNGGRLPEEILLAGGFGQYLNAEDALTIGMLPESCSGKIRSIGNAAGKGACMALDGENREKLKKIAALCSYEELSGSPDFNEAYVEAMSFDQ